MVFPQHSSNHPFLHVEPLLFSSQIVTVWYVIPFPNLFGIPFLSSRFPILFESYILLRPGSSFLFSVKLGLRSWHVPEQPLEVVIFTVYTRKLEIKHTNVAISVSPYIFLYLLVFWPILFCMALSKCAKLIVGMYLLICRWMQCMDFQKGLWPKRWLDQLQLSPQRWVKELRNRVLYMCVWERRGRERNECDHWIVLCINYQLVWSIN